MSKPCLLTESLLYYVARRVLGQPLSRSSDDPYWECPGCGKDKFHIFWATEQQKWKFKCFTCGISGDEDDLLWEKTKLDQGIELEGKAEEKAKRKDFPTRKPILQKYRDRHPKWLKTIRRHKNRTFSPPDPPVINEDGTCPCGHVPILSLFGISADDVVRHHANRIGANAVHVLFEAERHLKTVTAIRVYDDKARIEEMHVWGRQQYDDWDQKTFDEQEDLFLKATAREVIDVIQGKRKRGRSR